MTSLISASSNQSFLPRSLGDTQFTSHHPEPGVAMPALLDTLFEAALLCSNGKIVRANSAACALFGTSSEALAGRRLADCLLIKGAEGENAFRAPHSAGHSEQAATLLRQGDLPMEVTLREVALRSPEKDDSPQGHVVLLCERKEALPDIADWSLIERLPWPMMRVDARLNYLRGNAALACKLAPFVRLSEGEPLDGLGWPAAFCGKLKDAIISLASNNHAGTRKLPVEWQINRRQHRFIAELIPEHGPHGLLRSVLVAIHEDSTRQEEEASSRLRHVQEAHEHALAASHARDAFFGWVSHELRTPLNGIQSWAHILETCVGSASDSPLVARALHGIRTGIAQQLRLIEELVDVSRVIQGKLSLTRHTFALTPVAQSAAESLLASALSRRINLACRYTDEDTCIENDPCRVQQALYLLLSHALETSPRYGMVSFSVLRRRRHTAICITHGCSEAANHANHSDGSMPASHKDSRKQMNLLLARCLTERLGGSVTSRLSRKGDKMSHTLLLPLSGFTGKQAR